MQQPARGEIEPAKITVEKEVGLQLVWPDGATADFDLMTLRLRCPCAECQEYVARGETVWPRPASPQPLRITDAELHGAWGLGLTWNDGHSTGIYSYELLRKWAPEPRDD